MDTARISPPSQKSLSAKPKPTRTIRHDLMLSALRALVSLSIGTLVTTGSNAQTQPQNYDTWPLFQSEFESTGGGGIIIKGYDPVITGNVCKTDFTATEPNGTVYYNSIEFDAVPEQGGILCTNGRWRAKDGSSTGTTPFKVFFKDGIKRRSP